MSVNKKKLIIFLLLLLAVVIVVFVWCEYQLRYAPNVFIDGNQKHSVYIDRDDTADSVMVKIEREQVMKRMSSFRIFAERNNFAQSIHTGRYELKNGMTNTQLLRVLMRGYQTPVRITFNNIRTNEALAKRLSTQLMIDSTEIITALNDSAVMAPFGLNRETALALFLPDTYEVYWDISVNDLLAYENRQYRHFWTKERLEKAANIGLTPLEVNILASIVEEETNYAPEKPTVAGVYLNRLRRGMPLQADPTVKFAWQDFGLKRILFKHLEIDSPYNTYKYGGLPPGLIRMPSASGIDAVLNYERHNYIYMCAKEDFSGAHCFAATLAEHNRNAALYQKALNKLNIY
ncbi:MAG: endolytic transglycosylase MltG [Prevotellaceae bacterium]|nr:endolytic transglycosylase MltG [Prevotellaceae bacterium]